MTINSMMKSVSMGAAIGLCLASFNTTALAQKTISLTAVDGYPPRALQVKTFIKFLIPEVDKRLAKSGDYKIRWNQAFAGQIVKVKNVITGMQKGLGDIGVVTTVFHADKVPLQLISYATPFTSTDPVLVARTIDKLAERFPEFKQAWAKYNQVYLTNVAVLDSYQPGFPIWASVPAVMVAIRALASKISADDVVETRRWPHGSAPRAISPRSRSVVSTSRHTCPVVFWSRGPRSGACWHRRCP